MLLICLNTLTAQNKNLSILPSNIYTLNSSNGLEDILDTDNHKILLAAYKATNLNNLLDNSGSFTIFAPSDAAFSELYKKEPATFLSTQNRKQLKSILKYHIVSGKLTAAKILKALCKGNGKASFRTIKGEQITMSMQGLDIIISDNQDNFAKITKADAVQGSSVMHEIDNIIIPTTL